MTLREILARRETIRAELHSIMDANSDGSLTDEIRSRADDLEAEANRLTDQERRQVLIDDLDRRAGGTPIGGTGGDRFEVEARQVRITDVIKAGMGIVDAGTARAREVSQELERRSGRRAEGLMFSMALSGAPAEQRVFTTTNPAGGPGSNLIATDVYPGMIDRLREKLVIKRLGATVLGGLQGNLSIPRLKASATAYWVAEDSPITVSDPQTEAVGLTPKTVGGRVEVSRNMILQSSPDVTRMIENDLAGIIAVAIDAAAITGGGSNQPSGLLAAGSGITIVAGGTNGLAPSWGNVMSMIASVDTSNALTGSLGFLANGKAVKAMRTVLKTAGDTSSNFLMPDPESLAGYPLVSTQNVPSTLTKGSGTGLSALIFGDWSQLILGFWSELDILVNPYESSAYAKGNIQVRAIATCDVAIRHPLAFAAITDLIAP